MNPLTQKQQAITKAITATPFTQANELNEITKDIL